MSRVRCGPVPIHAPTPFDWIKRLEASPAPADIAKAYTLLGFYDESARADAQWQAFLAAAEAGKRTASRVSFLVLLLFALGNAGVALDANLGAVLANPVALSIVFGLVLGKQAGVTLFAWLAVRGGLA